MKTIVLLWVKLVTFSCGRKQYWVSKWICLGKDNNMLVDKKRIGRPKILSNTAKRLVPGTKI